MKSTATSKLRAKFGFILKLIISAALVILFYLSKPSPFVKTSKTKFIKDGKDYRIFSANYYQAIWLAHLNKTAVLEDLDFLADHHINNIRIMAGSYGPITPFRITPPLLLGPGSYSKELLESLDFILHQSSLRSITVTLCLDNYWIWSGGFSQIVSWSTNTTIPLPQTWLPDKQQWSTGSEETFKAYTNQFYTSTPANKIYKSHLKAIISRVNTITKIPYSRDPTIFSLQLANEPQSPPLAWIREMISVIKSMDKNHLISLGLESNQDQDDFERHVDGIDYATVHIWAQVLGG